MKTYAPDSQGRCPHCQTVVRFEKVFLDGGESLDRIVRGKREALSLIGSQCPQCGRLILTVRTQKQTHEEGFIYKEEFLLWPLQTARPVPAEVPPHITADYREAALVLNLSPKASAALSRRCLQAVLVEKGGVKPKQSLSRQIDEVMSNLPSYIAESVDAVRNIGNFAAHPMKDTATGEIVDVEPGEAEWNLDVLDMLFDFYFVQPALVKQKRNALDAKLKTAGKPPVK